MPVVELHERPDVVAVIPTLGGDVARLHACVASVVRSAGDQRIGILVVLNSSTAVLDPIPGATIEISGVNLGFPGGVVFGASVSRSELIWLVQDDMVVDDTCLASLVAALADRPSIGAVGPLVIDELGLVPPTSCGGVMVDGIIVRWVPEVACPPEALTGLDESDFLPSRGMLVRRSVFERTGGMNPRMYPVQFADVDFSLRMRRAGFAFRIVTEARTRHAGAASTPRGFGMFLHERNAQALRAEWFPESPAAPVRFLDVGASRPDPVDAVQHPLHPALDAALLSSVARSAADALTHLGRVYSAALDERGAAADPVGALAERDGLRETVRLAEGDLVHARRDIGTLNADLAAARAETEQLRLATTQARAALADLHASTSWRVTAPLRRLRAAFRRR